ncbi:MAG TPA: ornithine carbamoyltransferase [Phycisphaerales bacterium]|nr:ornithine carbamoyltransferase [Phycisphaerales bacterium]
MAKSASRAFPNDFLTLDALSPAQLRAVLATAAKGKNDRRYGAKALSGTSIVMLFEKPSLRTRVSFEVGINRLGGHALFYDHSKERIGERESVPDYGRNLERFCDGIVARVYSQEALEELAANCGVPVVNALSDAHHPCQALADVLTITEHLGGVEGKTVAYVGDGNNVALSLAQAVVMLGGHMAVVTPKGYGLSDRDAAGVRGLVQGRGSFTATDDRSALQGVDVIYTDAWVSMHHGASDAAKRSKAFKPFQVNSRMMADAGGAIFMHCLPAERGVEVTADVVDGAASVVFDQAENRLHAQNALLMHLLGRA